MKSSLLLRIFPPPKFLTMPYVGLEISDDALRCLKYEQAGHGLKVARYAETLLKEGVIVGGEIKDEKALMEELTRFAKENRILYAKVSLPEEKSYLFQTDVPDPNVLATTANIESKIEENVPLSLVDAVFYFDFMPVKTKTGDIRTSVSVVARAFAERQISLLNSAGIKPIAFEVVAKSIARATIPANSDEAILIIHAMKKKTGVYVVMGGVVCFSSTMNLALSCDADASVKDELVKEVNRVNSYWTSRPDGKYIARIIVVGAGTEHVETCLAAKNIDLPIPVSPANVWTNAFDVNKYMPPVSRQESLSYAVVAGLALPF